MLRQACLAWGCPVTSGGVSITTQLMINEALATTNKVCLPTEEALHGLASSPGVTFNTNRSQDYSSATSFPQPILMGAAFDDALIRAVATVVSTEARAYNNVNRSGLDY